MRPALCALLLLASCATPANQPAQAGAEAQVWRGTLRCEILPTLTTLALVQPIEVTVQGGQANYRRFVRIADTDRETSVPKHGGGPVALDGAVVLRGSATGRFYTYSSVYEG